MSRFKITYFLLLFVLFVSGQSYTQDSAKSTAQKKTDVFVLPQNLNVKEYLSIFEKIKLGILDPFVVIGAFSKDGDNNLSILTSIFIDNNLKSELPQQLSEKNAYLRELRHFTLLVLNAINSEKSYARIQEIIQNQSDSFVKGAGLILLSEGLHNKTTVNSFIPDPSILYLFLKNYSDTTYITHYGNTVGKICSEAISKWSEITVAEQFEQLYSSNKTSYSETSELWWNKNKTKIKWNNQQKRFLIN